MTPELKITWSVEPDVAKGTLRIKRILVEDFGEVPLTEAQPSGAYLVLDRLMKDRTFEDWLEKTYTRGRPTPPRRDTGPGGADKGDAAPTPPGE